MVDIAKAIVTKNDTTKRMALKLWRQYQEMKARRDFYSRIKTLGFEKYIDTSNRPDINVIILTLDCLRYSNLSFAGYHRETTPFLDSLRVKFRAISAAPWTYPSVASILTGLYPHNHNAYIHSKVKNFDTLKSFKPIRKSVLTLPEVLFALGYDLYFGTSIDVATYPLKGRVVPERYSADIPAGIVLKDFKKWVSKRRKPFFAYLHLGDLHGPIPEMHLQGHFGKVEPIPNITTWDFRKPEEQNGEHFKNYVYNRTLLYDNALRYLDEQIEDLYDYLEKIGVLNNTIIVITADHGDEFWEHARLEAENFYDPRGYYGVGHGHNVFNEVIEVPIILDGALERKGDFIEERVSHVDIMPTILDLLGVSHNLIFDGQNLFEVRNKKRPLLSEAAGYGYEKKVLILGRYKLLYAPDDGVEWLFDLKKDASEQHPIKDKDVTSIFVNKLKKMLEMDEKRKLGEVIKLKSFT
ncbi:sulfatase [Thermococcus atlanticus]